MLLVRRRTGIALRQLHSSAKSQSATATPASAAAAAGKCPIASQAVQKKPAYAKDEASLQAARPLSEMPGPKGWPLIGVVPEFASRPGKFHEAFDKWSEHGDIIKFKTFAGTPWEVVSYDVEVNHSLFMESASNPLRPPVEPWIMYRQDRGVPLGIVMSNNGENSETGLQDWKRHRVVAAELLKPDRVASYVPRVANVADDFADSLKRMCDASPDGTFDTEALCPQTLKFGYEAGSSVLLGQTHNLLKPEGDGADTQNEFFGAVQAMFKTTEQILFRETPLWKWFHTKVRKEIYQNWDDVTRCAREVVKNRGGHGAVRVQDGAQDFVDHIYARGDDLSEAEKDTLMADLITGAVDTTSSAMQILIHQAAVLPEVQDKMYADITDACGDGSITAQALAKMKYTRNCVDEMLRINPVLPTNARMFSHDVSLRGFRVPAMTKIHIANLKTSFDESVFPCPNEFQPERFDKPHKLARVASATFGIGARMCPAKRFATMEITLGLLAIVRKFRLVSKTHTRMPEIRSKLLLSPDPADNHKIALVPR